MMKELSVVEQLSYATIRIVASGSDGTCCGTGFIMSFHENDKNFTPVLVSNGHVMEGADSIMLCFTKLDSSGSPTEKWCVDVPTKECLIKFHECYVQNSDTDLCAVAIAPFVKCAELEGCRLFYRMLPMKFLATEADYSDLMQLDEIAMVGYPNAIVDEVNNQPIFRRGVLATSPSLDYNGRKEFLTDIATIGGSSGSPVLCINNGVSIDQRKGSISLGGFKCKLLGVHRGGFRYNAAGELVVINVPEARGVCPTTRIPINLGIVIKSSRIRELEQDFPV